MPRVQCMSSECTALWHWHPAGTQAHRAAVSWLNMTERIWQSTYWSLETPMQKGYVSFPLTFLWPAQVIWPCLNPKGLESALKKREREGFPGGASGKESVSAGITGDADLIPGSGRSPGVGNGNPLQYSCMGHCMNRGSWRAHWAPKSQICLSDWACTYTKLGGSSLNVTVVQSPSCVQL